MREDNRIEYIKEAAKNIAHNLNETDFLGVVAFDVAPFVVVPLESAGRLRASIDKQISRIKPAGRTYFLRAVAEAKRQLERISIERRHIVLLSDGESGGNRGELIELVKLMRNQSQITVSTVAIGKESNIGLMKTVAQHGGGFFQLVCDPSILPHSLLNLVLSDRGSPPQQSDEAQNCP